MLKGESGSYHHSGEREQMSEPGQRSQDCCGRQWGQWGHLSSGWTGSGIGLNREEKPRESWRS